MIQFSNHSNMKNKEIEKLYDSKSFEIMQTAEDAFKRGEDRVHEIKNFALKAGFKRISIAHCVSFPKEAEAVRQFLKYDFEVYSVDCKCRRIAKQEMLGYEGNGIMCNPAGQAEFLNENNTELNISIGLCVGHGMVFNQKSASLVSTLIVKDRVSKHNPLESIHNLTFKKDE